MIQDVNTLTQRHSITKAKLDHTTFTTLKHHIKLSAAQTYKHRQHIYTINVSSKILYNTLGLYMQIKRQRFSS